MKRFLSIFAILAMVVSMFSGVAFAEAQAGVTYTIDATTNATLSQVTSDVVINITPTGGTDPVATELNGYKVGVYDSTGSTIQKKADGTTDFFVTIADGKITLAKADVEKLAAATYVIKLDVAPTNVYADTGFNFIDLNASGSTYEGANDAKVENASLVVAVAPVKKGATYTIENKRFKRSDAAANIVLGITATGGSGSAATDLDGYKVGVYSTDGTLQKKADNTDFFVNVAGGNITLAKDDVNALAKGVYTVKLDFATHGGSTHGLKVSGDFQYIDLNGSDTYVEADDAKIVLGTLTANKVYQIVLDETKITYNENNLIASIPGKIIDFDSKAIVKVDGDLVIKGTSYGISYKDGQFNFKVYPSALNIGQFEIEGTNTFTDAEYKETAEFTVQYAMELAEPATLEFKYPIAGQIVVQGVFNNEDAKKVYGDTTKNLPNTDLTLAYVDANGDRELHDYSDSAGDTPIATASFSNNKTFGFLFDGSRIYKSGKIGIFLKIAKGPDKYLLLKSGKITVDTFETSLTKELPEKLGKQNLVFTLNLPSKYFDKVTPLNLVAGYKVTYKIYKTGDEDKVAVGPTGEFLAFDKKGQIKEIELDLQKTSTTYPRDEYSVDLELKKGTITQLTSTANFSVVKANNYNLLKWEEETKHRVGDFTFAFDGTTDVNQNIFVKNSDGDEEIYTEIIFDGCGLDNKKIKSKDIDTDKGKDTFTISTKETGILEATINVYEKKDDDKPAATFKREVKIVGWNVTISSTKVTVESEEDIVFEIVDEEGNSVNNGYIRLMSDHSKILVDGRKTNINGGVYTYKEDELDLFDNVEPLGLEFCVDDADGNADVMVTKASGITVVGKEVFTVTPSVSALLNGIEQKFTIEVLDENGDVVYPNIKRYDIDEDGNENANTAVKVGSRKDIDGDGINESIEITVTANADQPEMLIRPRT
ncbi:hypothetical protein IMX26_12200 [Clostridium sp. 'deep sea']|uniref:hypothetical protein n=1 Tax=Clostridium sp. 'deep sea' TaxID=2779445 RepID=UPI0018969E01|nr:hypothetical protein [Clostridium sp. 'deep sea']QOR34248.1 hypothetical protein IMX26_12200 [Clostridium sp. 'deep sea']